MNRCKSRVANRFIRKTLSQDEEIINESGGGRNFVLNWLDEQTPESVLYISFGSGGALSLEQLAPLAFGLELSEHKFIWVVRPPSEVVVDYLDVDKERGDGTPQYLPEGFLTRTKKFGLVIQMWSDQGGILSHPSVGGFLSHCGWNSCIESITNGVPIIAWPLYAEQRQNATMLTEELGVAVKPKVLVVEREENREIDEIGNAI
nr:UDP-glycosyltransferase [Nicotiana tabacum]